MQRFAGPGTIGIDNADRVLPELETVDPDADGWLNLAPGAYHITYAETVSLPEESDGVWPATIELEPKWGVIAHRGLGRRLFRSVDVADGRLQPGRISGADRRARGAARVHRAHSADDVGYQGIYQGENQR